MLQPLFGAQQSHPDCFIFSLHAPTYRRYAARSCHTGGTQSGNKKGSACFLEGAIAQEPNFNAIRKQKGKRQLPFPQDN